MPDFSDDEDDAEHTGTQSWVPDFDDDTGEHPAVKEREADTVEDAGATPIPDAGGPEPVESVGPVQPVNVPGRYLYLKWWKLAMVLLGVWAAAAVIGLGLFYWWYHSVDKTAVLFVVLVYVVVCIVGGVMLAMTPGRPLISALSVAMMSGPFAALVAAAPLYGYYHCERVGHCLVGLIPY
ncbi:Protein Rv0461 [Mycobacterium senriense]